MTRGLGDRIGSGFRVLSSKWLVLLVATCLAGAAQAGPTTVKVITGDGPAAGVEVWVYDAESGEKLRYGRTNSVGEVEFDDLEEDAQYEAQTLDGTHRSQVFTGNDRVVPLALEDAVPVIPVVEEAAVEEQMVEEEVEEIDRAPSESPWGTEILIGVGGGASSYDMSINDPSGVYASSGDGIYGVGLWQAGVQVLGPSWLIFLDGPRPFVRVMFDGDFNESKKEKNTGPCCSGGSFNSSLSMRTKFRIVGALGVALPLEAFGYDFELEPFVGFGAEFYKATGDVDINPGSGFGGTSRGRTGSR